jgi:hypothetical protein
MAHRPSRAGGGTHPAAARSTIAIGRSNARLNRTY